MGPQKEDRGARDFFQLADASPGMIWMADPGGLCRYVNPAWLEFRGTRLEQELGAGWVEGIHPEDRNRCQRNVDLAIRSRASFRISFRALSNDGTYYEVEDLGSPWYDGEGRFQGYLGSVAVIQSGGKTSKAAGQLLLLSRREREVLELVAQGRATKQVAAQLGICYKTADSHRNRLLKKLGMHETASLVRFAIRAGVISG